MRIKEKIAIVDRRAPTAWAGTRPAVRRAPATRWLVADVSSARARRRGGDPPAGGQAPTFTRLESTDD